MTDTITAAELVRNDRVVLDPDDLPHLVDRVMGIEAGVRVTFSSGEEREYAADEEVTLAD